MEIIGMTALELADKIKNGEVTVKDAVEAYIKQIEEKDGQYNAFITVAEKEKLEQRIAEVQQGIADG